MLVALVMIGKITLVGGAITVLYQGLKNNKALVLGVGALTAVIMESVVLLTN